ncbi:hypothetical protein VNO77_41640 [Canavalia gladiata]|uniref:DUF7081 domain-containing protein n=1 Tax=Canavalia gladiata TaxID=3824 RepID=A0AAN9K2P7_CANGL
MLSLSLYISLCVGVDAIPTFHFLCHSLLKVKPHSLLFLLPSSFSSMPLRNARTRTSGRHEKESLDNDAPIEGNAPKDEIKEKTSNLPPVSPFTSGDGLPYAPEGWPNPGDVWGWKVGRRMTKSGYFHDRYLFLPKSLQTASRKAGSFQSKPDVVRYLKANFPNMEIEAFFALFSWQIPSAEPSPTKVGILLPAEEEVDFYFYPFSFCDPFILCFLLFDVYGLLAVQSVSITPLMKSLETGEGNGTQRKLKRKAHLCSQPTRKSLRLFQLRPHSPSFVQDAIDVIDLCYINEEAPEDLKDASDYELDQSPGSSNGHREDSLVAVCNLVDSNKGSDMQTPGEKQPNITILENFDDYLATLEDLLVLPHTETSPSDPGTPASTVEKEMTESCKKKLSSLLAMDFPALVSCNNVVEVAKLASQIRKDPSLSVDEVVKLKLVEQFPLVTEAFLEAQGNIDEADKFFADLEAKILKVSCLKNEYKELKDEVSQIEAAIDKSSLAIYEIDDQIFQLQSKREDMSNALETMQKRKNELTSRQTMVANSIPTSVNDIQLGLSEKPKWEMKKAICDQRVVEIQEKFITLRGLTF